MDNVPRSLRQFVLFQCVKSYSLFVQLPDGNQRIKQTNLQMLQTKFKLETRLSADIDSCTQAYDDVIEFLKTEPKYSSTLKLGSTNDDVRKALTLFYKSQNDISHLKDLAAKYDALDFKIILESLMMYPEWKDGLQLLQSVTTCSLTQEELETRLTTLFSTSQKTKSIGYAILSFPCVKALPYHDELVEKFSNTSHHAQFPTGSPAAIQHDITQTKDNRKKSHISSADNTSISTLLTEALLEQDIQACARYKNEIESYEEKAKAFLSPDGPLDEHISSQLSAFRRDPKFWHECLSLFRHSNYAVIHELIGYMSVVESDLKLLNALLEPGDVLEITLERLLCLSAARLNLMTFDVLFQHCMHRQKIPTRSWDRTLGIACRSGCHSIVITLLENMSFDDRIFDQLISETITPIGNVRIAAELIRHVSPRNPTIMEKSIETMWNSCQPLNGLFVFLEYASDGNLHQLFSQVSALIQTPVLVMQRYRYKQGATDWIRQIEQDFRFLLGWEFENADGEFVGSQTEQLWQTILECLLPTASILEQALLLKVTTYLPLKVEGGNVQSRRGTSYLNLFSTIRMFCYFQSTRCAIILYCIREGYDVIKAQFEHAILRNVDDVVALLFALGKTIFGMRFVRDAINACSHSVNETIVHSILNKVPTEFNLRSRLVSLIQASHNVVFVRAAWTKLDTQHKISCLLEAPTPWNRSTVHQLFYSLYKDDDLTQEQTFLVMFNQQSTPL